MAEEKVWNKEKIKSRIDQNELDLSLCGISKVPVQAMLSFPKVTVLDLSCNKINILPDTFIKLTNLVQLDLSENALTELPENFGDLVKLKKLDLLKNNLNELPLSIRNLKQLQWLDLKENPIQEALPNIVGDCLKPVECQRCAKNIVQHYENLYTDYREKERKVQKREQDRVTKLQKEEETLRQRKREERKKKLQEKKQNDIDNGQKNENLDRLNDKTNVQSQQKGHTTSPTSCIRTFIYIFLLLLVCCLIVVVTYKGNLNELQSSLNKLFLQVKSYLVQLNQNITM